MIEMRYEAENSRIQFYIDMLGRDKAKLQCLKSARIYRTSVLNNGVNRPFCFASTVNYRRKYIESYLDFKRFAMS